MHKAIQLKIRLTGIEPEIWRRVVVPPSLSLPELHAVIQGAMGWQDYHLHSFEIDGKKYEIPEDDRIGPMDGYRDERASTLRDLLSKGMSFSYLYDFGDDWHHTITVEDIHEDHRAALPACVAGARACPPEDCGGPYRYPEFLDALSDPEHPEHEAMLEWIGEFESEAFNIDQANAHIKAEVASYRKR